MKYFLLVINFCFIFSQSGVLILSPYSTIDIEFMNEGDIETVNMLFIDGLNGYSIIKFIRYNEGHQMAEHCDHISSLFDGKIKGIPMLSLVGQLNEDFEGGEFVMWGDKVIEFEAGDLIIFPSNFVYPHRVEPVTKGARYSYVSWAY